MPQAPGSDRAVGYVSLDVNDWTGCLCTRRRCCLYGDRLIFHKMRANYIQYSKLFTSLSFCPWSRVHCCVHGCVHGCVQMVTILMLMCDCFKKQRIIARCVLGSFRDNTCLNGIMKHATVYCSMSYTTTYRIRINGYQGEVPNMVNRHSKRMHADEESHQPLLCTVPGTTVDIYRGTQNGVARYLLGVSVEFSGRGAPSVNNIAPLPYCCGIPHYTWYTAL